MASETDICNLALSHLGDSASVASIDPPEGSAQAEHCALFYPIVRDSLLEMHDWGFATKREALALLENPSTQWAYRYAAPNNMLRPLAVLDAAGTSDDDALPYVRETTGDGADVIYTDQDGALLRYVSRVTDTTRFSPLFVDLFGAALAAALAGPVIKGDAGAAASARWTVIAFGRDGKSGKFGAAAAADAGQRQSNARDRHRPAWIAGR